jgi:hypothetical protein
MVRRLIFAAAAAAALGMASVAQAAIHTMDVTWSGDMFGNDATATGVFTFDDSIVPDLGGAQLPHTIGDGGITALSVDVTGASSGNGHFTLADFSSYYFAAFSPLDYHAELVGQAMGNSCNYGSFSSPCYGGPSGDFNLFAATPGAPNGTFYFQLTTNSGEGDSLAVTSIRPGGVPEPAAWALMIGGFGLAGATLRRRRATLAA